MENDLKEKSSSHESIKSNLEEKLEESQDKVSYSKIKFRNFMNSNNQKIFQIEDLKADQAKSEKRITELKAERLDLISKIADGQDMAKQLTKQIQGKLRFKKCEALLTATLSVGIRESFFIIKFRIKI